MTAAPNLGPPPPQQSPLLDPDFANAQPKDTINQTGGRLTRPWYLFFVGMFARLNSLAAGSFIQSTQANLAALNLGSKNAGQLVWVTDYNHVLEWNGSAFQWGPGDGGGGYHIHFDTPPTAPGWVPMNGQATGVLSGDGSVIPVTLTSVGNYYFRQ